MPSEHYWIRRIESNQKQALIVVVVFASLSVLALSFVFLRAIWLVASPFFRRSSRHAVSKEYAFFHTRLGHYAACLLAGNLFAGAAGTVVGYWIALGSMHEGSICTAQAILMQIGNWAIAYFTVTMALHTCRSLVFRSPQKAWLGAMVIVIGWLSAVVVGFAPLKMSDSGSGSAYGFDGFTCGIKRVNSLPEFLFHLLPIFLAATVSAVIYSLIYLVLRGTLVIRDGLKINLDPQQRWSGRYAFDEYHRFIRAVAKTMLWFPFAYILLLLPYSITKLLNLSGYPVAFGANVFAETCAVMLGFVNVCILYNTFRVLEPAFECRSKLSTPHNPDTEATGGALEKRPTPQSAVMASEANGQNSQLVWHFPVGNNTTPSPSTLIRQKSISDASSDSSLQLIIPGHDNYGAHTRSSSILSSIAIGRTITPVSELKSTIVVEPESILQQSGLGMSDIRLQHHHARSSSTGSLQSLLSLQPPPRRTRPLVSRQATIETIAPEPPSKDQWPDADLRKSDPFSAHARVASASSVFSSQRGSFGVRIVSASPEELLDISGWEPGQTPDSFVHSAKKTFVSDPRLSISTVASKAPPAQPLPLAAVPSPTDYDVIDSEVALSPSRPTSSRVRHQPHVPSDVEGDDFGFAPGLDAMDDPSSNEVRSRIETVVPGGLTSLAWATLATNAATSNGSSLIPRSAASRDVDDSISAFPHVLRPRSAASTKSTRNSVLGTTVRRADSVSSIISGDMDVQVRQGPSKQTNGPLATRGSGLTHAPSSAAKQYYA